MNFKEFLRKDENNINLNEKNAQDDKAKAAFMAILDGMPRDSAITKYGVSPKKLDKLIKAMLTQFS